MCQGSNTIESNIINKVRSTYQYMCFDNVYFLVLSY
jgi:hypothetical protein